MYIPRALSSRERDDVRRLHHSSTEKFNKKRTVAIVESVPAEPGREVSNVVLWQGEKTVSIMTQRGLRALMIPDCQSQKYWFGAFS